MSKHVAAKLSRRALLAPLIAAPLMFPCGGCSIIGYVAEAATADLPVDPVYKPVPTDPMVVLAESFAKTAETMIDTETLQRTVTDDLGAHQVAPMIDPEQVVQLRSRDPAKFRTMPIRAIGEAVGAKQVLYLDVVNSAVRSTEVGANNFKGMIVVRVRIVDVTTGESLWPVDQSEGQMISAETPMVQAQGANEAVLRAQLMTSAAHTIGKLFYRHRPSD